MLTNSQSRPIPISPLDALRAAACATLLPAMAAAAAPGGNVTSPEVAPSPAIAPSGVQPIYLRQIRVEGATLLPREDVDSAVYPFLGPERTPDDVEAARAALEKAYKDKGFDSVVVDIPPQQFRGGVARLQVVETKVGRLRVKGSRYFLPENIKAHARSMAEGKVVNFNDVKRELVALNQLPDRRITPDLHAGVEPGTVDIDLNVKDKFPLHGNVELNNRYSADTSELRLNAGFSYNNLWQSGHTLGFNTQLSPENWDDVKVYSGYYVVRFPNVEWLSLSFQGTKQDSNVSTLGGIASAGRGEVIGARAIITLPPADNFFHSLSLGTDYKHFRQLVTVPGSLIPIETPISYYPTSALYSATWLGKKHLTELNAGVTFHFRGMGSGSEQFDTNRFQANGAFIYFRGDLSHTQDLPADFKVMGKVQGQIASQPLVNSEQIAGGGLSTVRGYLEAEVLGDNGVFGTLELQSPSLLGWINKAEEKGDEWRVYAFVDAGLLTVNSPLPEQEDRFELASVGLGSRIRLFDHFNGSLDAGVPLKNQSSTTAHDLLLTFRVSAEF